MSPVRCALGALVALVAGAGCGFDGDVGGTQYRCGAGGSCPDGYACAPAENVCFLVGGPDAGTPSAQTWTVDSADDFTANLGTQTSVTIASRGALELVGKSGVFETVLRDVGAARSFGRIRWGANTPSGTTMELRMRTCAAQADCAAAEWSQPLIGPSGADAPFPPKRYLQWRAEMTSNGSAVPTVEFVQIETK